MNVFKDDAEIRQWLEKNFPANNLDLNEEEVKKQFIANFGKEKYDEFSFTIELDKAVYKVAKFLDIPFIPFFFDDIKEDGRYYPDWDCFIINKKFLFNWIECLKCLIHELKHSHQRYCVEHKEDKNLKFAPKDLISIWEKELSQDERLIPLNELMNRWVEIDAFAFTKFALKKLFGETWIHFDPFTDEVFNLYIKKYFNSELD